jgi:hypothetical protein
MQFPTVEESLCDFDRQFDEYVAISHRYGLKLLLFKKLLLLFKNILKR